MNTTTEKLSSAGGRTTPSQANGTTGIQAVRPANAAIVANASNTAGKVPGNAAGRPASKATPGITPRERWRVASRVVAAFGLGYAFTWLFTAAVAVVAPAWFRTGRAPAVFIATQWSFMVYTLVVIWAFSVRRVGTVWWVLAAASAVCAGLLALLRGAP